MKIQRTLSKYKVTLPVSSRDLSRLALEIAEEMNIDVEEISRLELIQLLRRVLRAGIDSVRRAEKTVPFAEAAQQSIDARASRRPTTRRDLRHFVRRMMRVPNMAEKPLRSMTSEDCRLILNEAFGKSIHSFRKGRAILHSIFAFGRRRGWCDTNCVDCVDNPTVSEKEIKALQPGEVLRLMRTAKRPAHSDMQLSLVLMLYCGIRPNEVRRLKSEDIDWTEKVVHIRANSSKTGGGRQVPLRCCPAELKNQNPSPPNWIRRWQNLRRDAGFISWTPDILRHTFASYHAYHYRDLPALQIEMGHRDVSLLRTRYINTSGITRRSARSFWNKKGVIEYNPAETFSTQLT